MPKYLLSKEQHDYLVSIIEGRRVSEVTKMLNEHFGTSFTEKQIDAYKHNHKLKSGINPGRCLGSCRKYTMEQNRSDNKKDLPFATVDLLRWSIVCEATALVLDKRWPEIKKLFEKENKQ